MMNIKETDVLVDDEMLEKMLSGATRQAEVNLEKKEINLFFFSVSDKISRQNRSKAIELVKKMNDEREVLLAHELHHIHNHNGMPAEENSDNMYEYAILIYLDEVSAHVVDMLIGKKIEDKQVMYAIKEAFDKALMPSYMKNSFTDQLNGFYQYLRAKNPLAFLDKTIDKQKLSRVINFYFTAYNSELLKLLSKSQMAEFNVLFKYASQRMYDLVKQVIETSMLNTLARGNENV